MKPMNDPPEHGVRTIGVLGGLGPQATLEFERLVHAISPKYLAPRANSGYPPMAVLYYRHPLVRLGEDHHPVLPLQPDPRFLEAASALGRVSDFLVIISNGAHRFAAEVEAASARPVLPMIDLVLREVAARQWRTVGALAYFDPDIYTGPLQAHGLHWESVGAPLQQRLDAAIVAVMEGRAGPPEAQAALDAVLELRRRRVDGIILGCTEIPFLLADSLGAAASQTGSRGTGGGTAHPSSGAGGLPADLLDPLPLLAEAAVRRAVDRA